MALPTIVFVHGAWHWPGFFDKVKKILESKGYRTVALALPSVGRTPPVTSFDEDISVVRTAVLKELDAGNDVVVNAHSRCRWGSDHHLMLTTCTGWGGMVVNSSLDGLSKKEREEQGQTTAVIKLAFVAAYVVPEGVSIFDLAGGKEKATWLKETASDPPA
jgi:hypothetical protein